MNNVWFTSDHHFNHENMLIYEKEARPFDSVEEMNDVLVDRWNSIVKNNDTVFYLGDFAFGLDGLHYASKLNGTKNLVMGNHDNLPSSDYIKYFRKLYGVKYYADQHNLTPVNWEVIKQYIDTTGKIINEY